MTCLFPRTAFAGPDAPLYPVNVPLASLAVPGAENVTPHAGTHVVRSTAVADDDGTPTPPNAAELLALARQIASDWYGWALAAHDVACDGVFAWAAEGLTDRVEVRHDARGISTRARRGPWREGPGPDLLHFGSAGSADDAGPSLVRVTSPAPADGDLFAGELVIRRAPGVYRAVPGAAPVWLRVEGPDPVGPPPWVPDTGDVFTGCLPQGQRPADGRTVYVAAKETLTVTGALAGTAVAAADVRLMAFSAADFDVVPGPGDAAGDRVAVSLRHRKDVVTNQCPVLDTVGGVVVVTAVVVEFTRPDGSVYCVTNPTGCCAGGPGPGSGSGGSGGSGAGSGSGPPPGPPHSTPCWDDPVADVVHMTITSGTLAGVTARLQYLDPGFPNPPFWTGLTNQGKGCNLNCIDGAWSLHIAYSPGGADLCSIDGTHAGGGTGPLSLSFTMTDSGSAPCGAAGGTAVVTE